MLSTAIIVFREVLEASLIVGIACAATRSVARRGWWVGGGIAVGALLACVVAGFAGYIAESASGMGQEILNAIILLAAVVMLGWHNVWMARHGREMAAQMSALGNSVKAGTQPLYALGLVIALAVLREGSEVALFLYGIAAGGSNTGGMFAGGALGLTAGMTAGLVLYFGLLKVPVRHFFTVTSWMILLLAAGLASQAAHFLVQADILPSLGDALWDTSAILASDSPLGQVLRTLIGYDPRPAGIQLAFYLISLITIGVAMKMFGKDGSSSAARIAAAVLVTMGLATGTALAPKTAYAGPADKVYKPLVEYGETEIELRGGLARNSGPGEQAYILDIGHGFTPWWFTEIVGEYSKQPGASGKLEAIESENIFQLTEPGQYFADLALFLEYEAKLAGNTPNEFIFGPLLQKELGKTLNNLNLLVKREAGPGASSKNEYVYRFESQWRSRLPLNAGFQGFGGFGHDGAHNWGPALFGATKLGGNKLKYDAAALVALNKDSPDLILRWQMEFEFR